MRPSRSSFRRLPDTVDAETPSAAAMSRVASPSPPRSPAFHTSFT